MKYIESGRFTHPTLWVNRWTKRGEIYYGDSDSIALNIGEALELYKELTVGLREAGQGGMLNSQI